MQKSSDSFVIDVRVPSEEEVLENPRRKDFVGGGWVDSWKPNVICIYWRKRQEHFTVFSLLQVLEHEALHAVLIDVMGLDTSAKLDNIHQSSHFWSTNGKLVYVNKYKTINWLVPPYVEKPPEDLIV
jgi:hypothetical protein